MTTWSCPGGGSLTGCGPSSRRTSPRPSMHSAAAGVEPAVGAVATPAQRVVARDLDYMCDALRDELPRLSDQNLLITGGAGFLGYYLVQLALHWNRRPGSRPVRVTVFDSYVRGMPTWLEAFRGDPALTLVRHDMTDPLPPDIGEFQYIVHADRKSTRLNSSHSQISYAVFCLKKKKGQQDSSRAQGNDGFVIARL